MSSEKWGKSSPVKTICKHLFHPTKKVCPNGHPLFFVYFVSNVYASVRSTISASGAFFITEAMPFFMFTSLAYIWLVPMT